MNSSRQYWLGSTPVSESEALKDEILWMLNDLKHIKTRRRWYPRWVPVVVTAWLLTVICTVAPANAAPPGSPTRIVVLQSAAGGPYQEFTQSFTQTLNAADPKSVTPIKVLISGIDTTQQLAALSGTDLLVAVGTNATEVALRSKTPAVLLSVLVPRSTAEQLATATGVPPRQVTTIYLDQPIARYFALIRLVIPRASKVGMILGPVTRTEKTQLDLAARQSRISPLFAVMPMDSDNPLPALETILQDSDALLALPDPVVYNRYTLSPVLLTTFRYRIPVIGFSEALVNAGALAGVYSQPDQIGQQAAEMITSHSLTGGGRYPRYFRVSFNQAVANALDLSLPNRKSVENLLKTPTGEQ